MKFPQLKQSYTFIFTIVAIILGIFLVKLNNIWRVSSPIEKPQNQQDSINYEDLLNFEEKHIQWTLSETNNSKSSPPLFDLFTSPNIYTKGKQLVMEPCTQWQFDTVFPLRLKTIKNKKYRLQFEGYIQPNQNSKYTIILHDIENDQVLRCEEGQSFNSLDFTITSFTIKTTERNDVLVNIPMVQIFDSRLKQNFELTNEVKYYDDQYDVVLESTDGATFILSEIGKEVKIGESFCTLESVDKENNTVSIVLIDANKQEFHKRLYML